MSVPTIIPTDVHVGGTLSAQNIQYASGSVTDDAIQGLANIAASKQEGWFTRFEQLHDELTIVSTVSKMLHTVRGTTGTLLEFAGMQQTVAQTTVELFYLNLQRQTASTTWVTVLSSPIAFASSDAARTPKTGAFSTASLVAGDSLRVVLTTTGSASTSGAKGIACMLKWSEKYA